MADGLGTAGDQMNPSPEAKSTAMAEQLTNRLGIVSEKLSGTSDESTFNDDMENYKEILSENPTDENLVAVESFVTRMELNLGISKREKVKAGAENFSDPYEKMLSNYKFAEYREIAQKNLPKIKLLSAKLGISPDDMDARAFFRLYQQKMRTAFESSYRDKEGIFNSLGTLLDDGLYGRVTNEYTSLLLQQKPNDKPKPSAPDATKPDPEPDETRLNPEDVETILPLQEFAELVKKLDGLSRPKHGIVGGLNTLKNVSQTDGVVQFDIETANALDSGKVELRYDEKTGIMNYKVTLDQMVPFDRVRTGTYKINAKNDVDHPEEIANKLLETYERLRTNWLPRSARDDGYEGPVEDDGNTGENPEEVIKKGSRRYDIITTIESGKQYDMAIFSKFAGMMDNRPAYGFALKSAAGKLPAKFQLDTNIWLAGFGAFGGGLASNISAGYQIGRNVYNDTLNLDYDNKTGKVIGRLNAFSPLGNNENVRTFAIDIQRFKSHYENNPTAFANYVKGQYRIMVDEAFRGDEGTEMASAEKEYTDVLSRLNPETIAVGKDTAVIDYLNKKIVLTHNGEWLYGKLVYDSRDHAVVGLIDDVAGNQKMFSIPLDDFKNKLTREAKMKLAVANFGANFDKLTKDKRQLGKKLNVFSPTKLGEYTMQWGKIVYDGGLMPQRVVEIKLNNKLVGNAKLVYDRLHPGNVKISIRHGEKAKTILMDIGHLDDVNYFNGFLIEQVQGN